MSEGPAKNTDRELYREDTGNEAGSFYENSLFVTEQGTIGMNVGGHVAVHPIAEWHRLATAEFLRRGSCTCVPDSPERCGYCAISGMYGDLDADTFRHRRDALRHAIALLLPVWENREPDVSDAILCARWIETGRDPYADTQPLPSPDAMRSHP